MEFSELVSTGPFGSMLHKSDYAPAGVPLINPTNIRDDLIVPDQEKRVSGKALARLSNYVLKAGDVIVGRRGEIGRCAVVGTAEDGKMARICSRDPCRLRFLSRAGIGLTTMRTSSSLSTQPRGGLLNSSSETFLSTSTSLAPRSRS